jgi:hypothetical protein
MFSGGGEVKLRIDSRLTLQKAQKANSGSSCLCNLPVRRSGRCACWAEASIAGSEGNIRFDKASPKGNERCLLFQQGVEDYSGHGVHEGKELMQNDVRGLRRKVCP